jgi:sugar phosphate isomerase/epimerase
MPEAVAAWCEQIAFASRLGLPALSFSAGPRDRLPTGALERCVRRLGAVAEASHVRLEVKNHLGSRLEQVEDLRRFFTSGLQSGVRLRIDTGEFHAAAVNPRDVLAEFGDLTASVVISDRRGREEVSPGSGQVNLAGFVGDLVRTGYDGWLMVNARGDETAGQGNPVSLVRGMVDSALSDQGRSRG